MPCWNKFSFLFMNLRLRLNDFSLYSLVSVVVVCSLLSLVVYFLPRKMATMDYDVIAGAVREEEYKKTTWFKEPTNFARTERRCVRVIKRAGDVSPAQTMHALENVFCALIVGEERKHQFGQYKLWEADFLRHLLGYTTAEEEREFNIMCKENCRLCEVSGSRSMRMGKKFTALLRHGSPLTKEMYSNGTMDVFRVFDYCKNDINPLYQYQEGRSFAAFLQGNNKQRYFVEVYLNESWNLDRDHLPWKIFIGCTQGHSTGVVQATESAHKLSIVEMYSFGWIFHVTDQRHERSIYSKGCAFYV